MDTLQEFTNQIPIRHDLYSYIMMLGVIQGFFISTTILIKTARNVFPVKLLGFFILTLTFVLLDLYLCYTGLIKYCIHLNDSTEPIILLWAPLMYLFITGILERRKLKLQKDWVHFLIPVLYFITQIGYYFHPKSVKLTAYLSAYFPEAKRPYIPNDLSFYYELIKDQFRWIILFSFLIYIFLSIKQISKSIKNKRLESIKKQGINKYEISIQFLAIFLMLMIMIFTVFLNYQNDLGDHYIAIVQTLLIFLIGTILLSESRFFEKSWIVDKYETLKIRNEDVSIDSIKEFISREKYYLQKKISLKELSQLLDSNPNYLSKLINLNTSMNFNEFINSYRIELAKQRLISEDYKQLTIEAIGNSVGFKSKSAFYNAFKKQTKQTPTAYQKAQVK